MSAVPAPDPSDDEAREARLDRERRARHVRAAGLLLGALDPDGAADPDRIEDGWAALLSRSERLRLALHAIRACAADDAVELMEAALREMTGPPGVPFTTMTEEAANWVAVATLAEIKIYLLACFKALPKSERVAFLGAAQRVVLK